MNPLPRATEMAHDLVRKRIREGDIAVDATVGNGHDTLFLAELVGPTGKVIGFDIQEQAIEMTLAKTNTLPQVTLHQTGHETMEEFVTENVAVVMFNLGYLPSADKSVTTLPDTTTCAIRSALNLLSPGGLVTLAIYTGHAGGDEEAAAVLALAESLPQEKFSATSYRFLNQRNSPPFLIAIQKK
ncbi:MAG: class I SAM-dependent methyltransferase [Verrucomicrobiota bacterium]